MKTALLVIDFINDITHTDGKTPSCAVHVAERDAVKHANVALKYAREQGWMPILVKVGFSESYLEQPKSSPVFGKAHTIGAYRLGQWGTEFLESLDVQTNDLVVVKPRVNAFYATTLDAALRANKIERVVVCGVSTNWAIQSVVRDAHDRDYLVAIVENACAAANEQEHQTSIAQLSRIATITTAEQLSNLG